MITFSLAAFHVCTPGVGRLTLATTRSKPAFGEEEEGEITGP